MSLGRDEGDEGNEERRSHAGLLDEIDGIDELLHRAATGAYLSASSQAVVASHLRRCSSCAFLHTVRGDLRREDAFASSRDRARESALVAATLAALTTAGPAPSREEAPRSLRSISARHALPRVSRAGGHAAAFRMAAAAAVIVVMGLGGYALARLWQRTTVPETAPVASAPPPALPIRVRSVTSPPADAARLFAEARDARLRGRAAETARLYQELWVRFPSTPEALAGRVVLARWLLDRGDPSAAVSVFEDYLQAAPAGPLGEEVRVGIAESWEKLGRLAEARAAWNAILVRHPASAHAPRARERLTALEAAP